MTFIHKCALSGAAAVAVLGMGTVAASAAPASSHTTHQVPAATKTTKLAFSAHYTGHLTMLISGSTITVKAAAGTGTATNLGTAGKSTISGSGLSSAQSTCDAMSGTGLLSGGGSSLSLKIASGSQGCAVGSATPTKVNVTGSAVVTSGKGKYLGATGTLKFSGSFTLTTTTGSTSPSYAAALSGTLTVKS